MKIYVSVDIEGISGIVQRNQIFAGEPYYQEARRLLTREVNAVVEGLLQAGADEIIVKDAHASGFNFIVEDLHPGAQYFLGASPFDWRFPGIDASFDGAMLVGYHAMAGTQQATLDHTYSSVKLTALELNGRPIGEIGLDSLLFGQHGVPMLFVSGDQQACAEAKRELGPQVMTYQAKTAYGRHSALIKPPQLVHEEIKAAIGQAVAGRHQCKPHVEQGPYELIARHTSTLVMDAGRCNGEDTILLDGLSILYKGPELIPLLAKAI